MICGVKIRFTLFDPQYASLMSCYHSEIAETRDVYIPFPVNIQIKLDLIILV